MKKFHFSLQAIQTLRVRREQIALQQYAHALTARRQAMEALELLQHDCTVAWQLWQDVILTNATARELTQLHDYHSGLVKLRQQCEATVLDAQQVVDLTWDRLQLARRQREAVDKFHSRQRNEHTRAVLREDQKFLDDLASRLSPLQLAGMAR